MPIWEKERQSLIIGESYSWKLSLTPAVAAEWITFYSSDSYLTATDRKFHNRLIKRYYFPIFAKSGPKVPITTPHLEIGTRASVAKFFGKKNDHWNLRIETLPFGVFLRASIFFYWFWSLRYPEIWLLLASDILKKRHSSLIRYVSGEGNVRCYFLPTRKKIQLKIMMVVLFTQALTETKGLVCLFTNELIHIFIFNEGIFWRFQSGFQAWRKFSWW